MTTIAICGDWIAADSQIEGGHVYQQAYRKIHRTRSGILVAFAGIVVAGQRFRRWVEEGMDEEDQPMLEDEFGALVVLPSGKILEYGPSCESIVVKPPIAIGSGAHFAMGAMAVGASAADAVKAAMKFDSGTGGRVQKIRLK